ncbi:MAG: A/G-specific adenine glycosylase [Propionibacteriaceae bacterium]|jgi:A/G-specific adenine glycosylase|nr:A/G-specific adenine glycosylase [Propionibacteriaceae bacterium]
MESPDVVAAVIAWYDAHRRDLPWRRGDVTPWGVVVSEFMLQQTPVARVLEPWRAWMERWPEPEALAAEPSSAAVLAWGRLGYPRRALRLHEAAQIMTERWAGRVPDRLEDLRSLPGFGDYTAAAVACFAFGARVVVLDTNIRRVFARLDEGRQFPSTSPTVAERGRAAAWLDLVPTSSSEEGRNSASGESVAVSLGAAQAPSSSLSPGHQSSSSHSDARGGDDGSSFVQRRPVVRWNLGLMELGSLVCTARNPTCDVCPIQEACVWRESGCPAWDGPPRTGQSWHGTDRQCRGRLLAVLREAAGVGDGAVPRDALIAEVTQLTTSATAPREAAEHQVIRCLESLLADGLARREGDNVLL